MSKPTYEELEAKVETQKKYFDFMMGTRRTMLGLYAIYNADGAGCSPAPVTDFSNKCMEVVDAYAMLDGKFRKYLDDFAPDFLRQLYIDHQKQTAK